MALATDRPKLLTVAEAAAELRVHGRTLRRWLRLGLIRAVRIPGSRKLLIDARELEAALRGEAVRA